MRKQLYLSLAKRLERLVIIDSEIRFIPEDELKTMRENGTPVNYAIKHFDIWNNNVEFMDEEEPADFPLCFVEFMPIQWENLSSGAQTGKVIFLLHIVDRFNYPTSSNSLFKDKGLEYFELLDIIHLALSGFTGEGFSSITRTTSITNHNHEDIIESIEGFTCQVKDDRTAACLTKAFAKPVFSNK